MQTRRFETVTNILFNKERTIKTFFFFFLRLSHFQSVVDISIWHYDYCFLAPLGHSLYYLYLLTHDVAFMYHIGNDP